MKRAVIPGTFDPVTSGHVDVIERAAAIFDEIVIGVAASVNKNQHGTLFGLEQRIDFLREATAQISGIVCIEPFEHLLVDFVRGQSATVIVKGLRAMTDFEHEFQMAALNWHLDPAIETMFIMAAPDYMYLSSSAVKEIAACGGQLAGLVPASVEQPLRNRFATTE